MAVWTVTFDAGLSGTCTVRDEHGQGIGSLRPPMKQRPGSVVAGGVEYEVSRGTALCGTLYVLGQPGSVMANAVLPRDGSEERLSIAWSGREWTLQPRFGWRRQLALYESYRAIGGIAASRLLTRPVEADLPEEIAPCVRLFIVALAFSYWGEWTPGASAVLGGRSGAGPSA
ncbi:MAG: hypothetical protein ABFD77_01125 [Thermotogota bacterium]